MRSPWPWLAAAFLLGWAVGETSALTRVPVACEAKADSIRVHPTPWERERGRTVRTIPR
jgi:hypothetical protein